MRLILTGLAGVLALGLAGAQAQTSPGTGQSRTQGQTQLAPNAPGTLPQPGGGVSDGTGAPGSASPGVSSSGRGAPSAGRSDPSGMGSGTGGSALTPGGQIRPGNPTMGGTQNQSGAGSN